MAVTVGACAGWRGGIVSARKKHGDGDLRAIFARVIGIIELVAHGSLLGEGAKGHVRAELSAEFLFVEGLLRVRKQCGRM